MKSLVGRRARRFNGAAGVLSQGFNSLTNLGVAVLVAHAASPSMFGAWAVLLAVYSLTLQVSRALVVTPVLVHEEVGGRVPAWLSASGLLGGVRGGRTRLAGHPPRHHGAAR